MSGCFGDSQEDKWKENLSLDHYEMEEEEQEISCEWCHTMYKQEDSGAREPDVYCSPSCRMLHKEYGDDDNDGTLGEGEI